MASSDRHLLDLPTELLALIAGFLTAVDRIALFHTCTRFQDVCCTKSVAKHLDYSDRSYGLLGSSLKRFLTGKQLCDNVRVLNLNHCYWLRSDDLLPCIRRLKNLEELHLLECPVTINRLMKILGGLKHLVALSFWVDGFAFLRHYFHAWQTLAEGNLSGLKSLRSTVCNLLELHEALKYVAACRNLESLELSVLQNVGEIITPRPISYDYEYAFSQTNPEAPQQTLPVSLKAISIDLAWNTIPMPNYSFLQIIRKFISIDTSADQHWHKLCISGGALPREDWMRLQTRRTSSQFSSCIAINLSTLYGNLPGNPAVNMFQQTMQCTELYLDRLKIPPELLDAIANFCPRLTKLSLKHSVLVENNTEANVLRSFIALCENCNGITELHLGGLSIERRNQDLCAPLYNLKDLRRLSASPNLLFTPGRLSTESNQESTTSITLKKRIGMDTVITEHQMAQCKIWMLAKKTPLMEHLQIDEFGIPIEWHLTDIDLVCISKWTNLRHLSLSGHRCVRHGNFLFTILRECAELVTLKLIHLGNQSNCVYLGPLVDGLKHAQHLKDFSIVQDNLNLTVHFLEGLSHCVQLQRLYINKLSNLNDHLSASIVATLRKLPKLIFVYLRIDGTWKACKQLEKQIMGLRPERPPAFLCFIDKDERPSKPLLNCPAQHRSMFTF